MDIEASSTLNEYKKTIMQCMQLFTNMDIDMLSGAVDYSINKRYKKDMCTVDNSYTKKQNNMSLLALADYIADRQPIVTAHGTMFMKHADVPNPMGVVIQQFLDQRDIDKKEMFKFPKGSEDFEKYNLLQQLDKIDANGIYGVLGMFTSLLFNINVSTSITSQGRALISSATILFESFLSNSVKFGSLDEVLVFINNVCNEKREYKDSDILDEDVLKINCFAKIVDSCGYLWIPNDDELDIIWHVIDNLRPEDINRVYYKNNLYEFCSNTSMKKAIIYMMQKLEEPFFNPLKVPKEIEAELSEFTSILAEYVFYDKMVIDRIDRCDNMMKSVIVVSDTDSCIVSFDAWYRFVLEIIEGVDLKISRADPIEVFDFLEYDEFGDIINKKQLDPFKEIVREEKYDFGNDQIRYEKYLINPFEMVSSDYLRWSIVNIISTVISDLINRYMLHFTKNNHSWAPDKPCKIYMKNEFSFNRLLVTMVKKSYASIMKVQEGHLIPEDQQLDVKGIAAIAKSSMAESTRKELKKILLEDILTAPTIDQFRIVERLCLLEKKMMNSLREGSREFYKPVTIKALSSYESPMRIQGVKASTVWNELNFDPDLPNINLDERNAVDIAKIDLNIKNVEAIKDKYPELYDRAVPLLNNKIFGGKIDSIAIPLDIDVPDWVLDIIDYKSIINDNMKGFPYESVGLTRVNNSTISSNILQI